MNENSSLWNGEIADHKNANINGVHLLSKKVERAESIDKALHSSYKCPTQSNDITTENFDSKKHQQKSSATAEAINERFKRLCQRLELCKTLLYEAKEDSSDQVCSVEPAQNVKSENDSERKSQIIVEDNEDSRNILEISSREIDSSTLSKLEKVSLEPKPGTTNSDDYGSEPILDVALNGLCPECFIARVYNSGKTPCENCSKSQRPIPAPDNDKGYLWWYVTPIEGTDIKIVRYANERLMEPIMRLITKDLSEPYSIYTYRYFIDTWPHLCFVALAGEEHVGAIVCKLSPHGRDTYRGYIAMLAVDEKFRRHKIGTHLVTHAIEAMRSQGCDEVVLETEVTNKSAMRLYENLGFVRDKRLFRYYLNDVDAFRLKLWLKSFDRPACF